MVPVSMDSGLWWLTSPSDCINIFSSVHHWACLPGACNFQPNTDKLSTRKQSRFFYLYECPQLYLISSLATLVCVAPGNGNLCQQRRQLGDPRCKTLSYQFCRCLDALSHLLLQWGVMGRYPDRVVRGVPIGVNYFYCLFQLLLVCCTAR